MGFDFSATSALAASAFSDPRSDARATIPPKPRPPRLLLLDLLSDESFSELFESLSDASGPVVVSRSDILQLFYQIYPIFQHSE
jgi:hypothetical protein